MNRRSLLRTAAVSAISAACSPGGTSRVTWTPSPTLSPSPGPPATKATVELVKGGSFTLTLIADKAPETVARFARKARAGFYDNLTFHRVEDWVVQGGDPLGNGSGGEKVASELNDLPFGVGAVGMARGQDPSVNNGSQFFVTKKDSPFLNGQYTNFGQVTAGMDVVSAVKIGDRMK